MTVTAEQVQTLPGLTELVSDLKVKACQGCGVQKARQSSQRKKLSPWGDPVTVLSQRAGFTTDQSMGALDPNQISATHTPFERKVVLQ